MANVGRVREYKTRQGKPRYFLDLRPHGRVWSIPLPEGGALPLDNRKTAERLLEAIRARTANGEALDAVVDSYKRNGVSHVLHLAPRWLEAKRAEADGGDLSPRSVTEMEVHVRLHWRYWEGVSVLAIRAGHLEDWSSWLASSQALGPGTRRNVLALFKSFLRWLEARGQLRQLPRFPKVKVPETEPDILSREDQDRVLEAIPGERRGIYLAMVDLALRTNEARALQVQDWDGGEWLTVQRAAKGPGRESPVRGTKTGRTDRVPVTPRLERWLRAHVNPRGRLTREPLFPSPRGGMYSYSAVQREWRRASEAAGVEQVSVQRATRHSTATHYRRQGVPMDTLKQLLRHGGRSVSDRYARPGEVALFQLLRPE